MADKKSIWTGRITFISKGILDLGWGDGKVQEVPQGTGYWKRDVGRVGRAERGEMRERERKWGAGWEAGCIFVQWITMVIVRKADLFFDIYLIN